MEQGGVGLEAVGDLANAVVQHGIAVDPKGSVSLALPAQGDTDHVASDRAAQRRPWRQGVAVTWMAGLPGASS
jgi:hypothetical protein